MSDGHGDVLDLVDSSRLINSIKNTNEINEVRKCFGKKPLLQSWMKEALQAGWKPPENFNQSDYDFPLWNWFLLK